jgi:hypothetical protein
VRKRQLWAKELEVGNELPNAQKQIGRPCQERALFSRMVWPKLNGSSTAEEVEQDGNYGKNQQNVDESAGDVKRGETQQPQYQ